jgi:hypothetical protein
MHDPDVEKRFHQSVLSAYGAATRHCGLHEARFLSMVNEQGAVRAAKRILGNNQFVFRASKLVECGHAEYSMEHLVLLPEFAGLFTEQERLIARNRLKRGRKVRLSSGSPIPVRGQLPKGQRSLDRRKQT